jgi:Family of unknown function (DUF6049)
VHALQPEKTKRRTVSLAAAVAMLAFTISAALALGGPAAPAQALDGPAAPAQASPATSGAVSVAIGSMNPQWARPGSTVTLSGTVTNGTSQVATGLKVQLYISPGVFQTRSQMDSYLTRGGRTLEPAGSQPAGFTSLKPGATASWRASFRVSDSGITGFGVYPLAAGVTGTAGTILASDRTLLPLWPGAQAAGLKRPLDIAWVWPLIDQPHHEACSVPGGSALSGNDLAATLDQGGRLSALLQAGKTHPGAELTWFIDPALLSDAATMTSRYQVQSKPGCTQVTHQPASKAAASFLSALRTVMAEQQAVITPYANADMTALVHRGLNADLTRAFAAGSTVAQDVLRGTYRPSIAWPAGGTADLSVLTALAAAEHIGTVVLNSTQMPPKPTRLYHGDNAVTSIRTGAGTTMNVLLADDTLTKVLRAGNTSSGGLPQGTEFAVKQRFLAETAMIAAEEPNSARSIVAAPPQRWSPTAELAGDLLDETMRAPWLSPAPLASLPTAENTERSISRQPPPSSKASPGELGRGYLNQVATAGTRLGVYKSVLYRPPADYVKMLNQALAATESSAWRGTGKAQGTALTASLSVYLKNAEKRVRIISSAAPISMGGASGAVPVSIQNELQQAILVRLGTTVAITPGRTSQLTIGRLPGKIIIQPQQAVTVRLPVSSAPQGSTAIQLSLYAANGTRLAWADTQLTVQSTRYGRAILFLIAAAIGVLVLTSLYRAVRHWLHDDGHSAVQEAEPPGSVVTGSSGARHPTEAPDELADARRWADDA